MAHYYGIDEANQRLADLRPMLEQLRDDRAAVAEAQRELIKARATNGSADHADDLARRETEIRDIVRRMQRAVAQLDEWSIALRDISTGLLDFPALVAGRPIWLCWRLGEEQVGWWHEADVGFDQRQPLTELT
jgi:hypothetical protein